MAITREEIIQAAETLEREGNKATMNSVRDHLGGGSFATISPVLREWKEGRKTIQSVVLDMPGELKTVMERQASEFWQAASALANEKLITVQRESEAAVLDAHNERDETLQEVTRLEASLSTSCDSLLKSERQKEDVQANHDKLQTEAIRLHEKLTASHSETVRLRDDLNRANKDKERNADEASRLLGLTEQLKQELSDAKAQTDTQRQEATQYKLEAGNLKNQLEQSKADQEQQKATLEQQQAEVVKLKTVEAALNSRVDDRNIKIKQLESELASLRKEKQEDTHQLATANAERDTAKTRIRELSTECGELREENKSLLLLNDSKKKNDQDQN